MTSLTIDLNNLDAALGDLDDDVLIRLHNAAQELMQRREEERLPATVVECVRKALADAGHTGDPVSVEFCTTEWPNGFFWYDGGAAVTFADGSTTTVDLDRTEAEEALTEHASWQDELTSSSTLTVTFEPLSARVS